MARYSYPGSTTGSELGTKLNEDFDDILKCHRGTSRPSYLDEGYWIDESGSEPVLTYYDGSTNIPLYTINETEGIIQFDEVDDYALNTGITGWAHGLSNEEIDRIDLQSGEILKVDRISYQQKGGGSSTNSSVRIRDLSGDTTLVTQDLGGVTKDAGRSSSGNVLSVQLSNSTGDAVEGSVSISAKIEQAG